MSKFNRRSSLLVSFKNHPFDEEKVIEEALTTPYEKVIKILNNVKFHLQQTNAKNLLIKDLDWVIDRISSHNLYNYEISDQTKQFQQITNNSHEVKSFFEYLNNFSENKDTNGRRNNSKSKTQRFKQCEIKEIKDKIKKDDVGNVTAAVNSLLSKNSKNETGYKNIKKSHTVTFPKPMVIPLKEKDSSKGLMGAKTLIGKLDDDIIEKHSSRNSSNKHVDEYNDSNKECSSEGENDNYEYEKLETDIITVKPNENLFSEFKDENVISQVFSNNFDIFEFESKIGRDNVLPEGAKAIFQKLNLIRLISAENLDNFLINIRDGYLKDTAYHNDLHGFDVCQTISIYLCQTDIAVHLFLDELDIISIILSALMHDIGHPGYNNSFQVNSLSDMAITYNDKSVLENYHVSSAFKILKKLDSNILQRLNLNEFKHIRKRMIESILSTDMIFHAKIHTLVKNKLAINDIKFGINIEKIVDKKSVDLFEEQQSVINFLMHTADVSHNSKEFKISSKWTDLLMEEFWMQGDIEKKMGYPVSFLCDRTTAEVPKSQIGFIKSIIIPTFETLVDMIPKLNYYRENVYNNLDQWSEIVSNENEQRDECN